MEAMKKLLEIMNMVPWAIVFMVLYALSEALGSTKWVKENTVYQFIFRVLKTLVGR